MALTSPLKQCSNAANIAAKKSIEETYQKKSLLDHILLRPDSYIGSVKHLRELTWIYQQSKEPHRFVFSTETYVPGLLKIFDEILVNAADNKQIDPKMDSLKVMTDVENCLISVYNNGAGVPVEMHKEARVYVPELVYGYLLTSGNFDDDNKTIGGRNGFGAKLANIFSTQFIIEVADGKNKYKQIFSSNMRKKDEPIISRCEESWTKITFKPDLAKFGMTHLENGVVEIMHRRVFDMAAYLGKSVKVELNDTEVPVKSFSDYVDMYLGLRNSIDLPGFPTIKEKVNERWEVGVTNSYGFFRQASFVNGIATFKGGTHVDFVTNQIVDYLIAMVKKKDKKAELSAGDVKRYLWVFINARIDNPTFSSQSKDYLTVPPSRFGSKCKLSQAFLQKVAESGFLEDQLRRAQCRQLRLMRKSDGEKTQTIHGIRNLEDAIEAGTDNSHRCTLILTEGESAKALAMAGLSVVGRNYYGVFPLRGKLLNVREAGNEQIKNNEEINNLKRILGLKLLRKYTDVTLLRYGHLMIMTDQDHDGSHIKGLVINFLHSLWPSLLKIPSFLVEFVTPIVKATHRSGKALSFYTMPEYESWKKSLGGNASGWSIKYYKGLGTSTSEEGKEYFRNLEKHKKDFVWVDGRDDEAIELAFSKKKIEARKNCLRQFEHGTHIDQTKKVISYSEFINKELVLFSMADLQRSIPSMVDGFKPGQRKIIFCAFKRNFVKEAKVAQFSGYVSEHSSYHHGEQSLTGTIVGMAQDFVGSNNINLFQPNGQFGSRLTGGKDAASARYIYTKLSPITRSIFCKDDDKLLNYLDEDGHSIEPTWYMPIIPMVLVNGSEGIGTGWSTYIPKYNTRDIIANIRRLLNGERMEPMDPWYRGFNGIIAKNTNNGYTAVGTIEKVNKTTLKVTELPIRRWTQDYKEFLESLLNANEIQDFIDLSDTVTVDFEIFLSKVEKQDLVKKFKLNTNIGLNNMHLFNTNGVIKKYDSPEQILEEFFPLRLEYYEKRKKVVLDEHGMRLLKLSNKVKFILAVVNGEIIVNNRKKDHLFIELQQKGFTPFPKEDGDDYDYLLSLEIESLTSEKIHQLRADEEKLIQKIECMKNVTPKCLWLRDLDALEKELGVTNRKWNGKVSNEDSSSAMEIGGTF